MNALTRQIVTQVAQENKALARRNDDGFRFRVREAHWAEMIARYGWQMKVRALELWKIYHPEHFEGEFLRDYDPRVFDLDVALSHIVSRVLGRKIKRTPDLQLFDWGDLPQRVAEPQMALF